MLKIVCGPYHALEETFLRRAGETASGSPARPLTATPSRACADRLQELLTLRHGASGGITFHTFISLAVNLAAENPPPRRAASGKPYPLAGDPGFHDFAIRFILEKFPECRPPAQSRGFVSALRSTLRDLSDALVDPRTVLEHAREGAFGPGERDRVEWLMRVFSYYRKCAEYVPATNYSELFACAAQNAPESKWLAGFGELVFYGFYDLTGLQLELFRAVAAGRSATLYYPYVKDHPAYEFARRFYESRLAGLAAQTEFLPPDWGSFALSGALDALFRPDSPAAKIPREAVSVVSVSGHADEVYAAAKEILSLKERHGLDYSRIAVIARTLEPYRRDIPEIFRENLIAFEAELSLPLLSRPLAQFCRALLRLRRDGYPAHALRLIFGSPYFNRGGEGARWRELTASSAISGGFAQWRALAAGKNAAPEFLRRSRPADRAADGLGEWLKETDAALAALELPGDWTKHAAAAQELLESSLDEAALSDYEKTVLASFYKAVSGLEMYALVRKAESAEFLDELEARLDGAQAPAEGEFKGGVRVLDAMGARGQSFDAVILLGLNEKLFPRLVREDPVLRDGPRRFMRDTEGFFISPKLEGYDEEQLLFHLAASSARKRLVCVFQRSDEEGRAAVPSLYLAELCRSCGFSLEDKTRVRVLPRRPLEKIAAQDELSLSKREVSLKTGLSAGGVSPESAPPEIFPAAYSRRQAAADEIAGFGAAGARDGLAGRLEFHIRKTSAGGISPSAAESLARCPMQYFLGRVIGLEADEAVLAGDELDAAIQGRLYHEILRRAYSAARKAGIFGDAQSVRCELEECCSAVLSPATGEFLGLYPVLWEVIAEQMRARLAETVGEDIAALGGWAPEFFEKEMTAGLAGMGAFKWHGIADRIDVNPQKRLFRVVDYKRTPPRSALKLKLYKGEMLQPFVYPLLAACAAGELKGLRPAGAVIIGVEADSERGDKRFRELDFSEIAPYEERIKEGIAHIVSLAETGAFFIRPQDGEYGWCRYCSFGSVCRKNHPPSRRRAANSPQCRERERRAGKEYYEPK